MKVVCRMFCASGCEVIWLSRTEFYLRLEMRGADDDDMLQSEYSGV